MTQAGPTHAFGDDDRVLGALFANQAGLALLGAQRAAQLDRAVASRDVIGTAKGILMERFGIDDNDMMPYECFFRPVDLAHRRSSSSSR
mgnify:CR=1 FL=1